LTRGARAADYLTKVVVVGKISATLPVEEIMTPESKLMTVVPQQSVLDVMKLMMKYNFRHVPVVRARGRWSALRLRVLLQHACAYPGSLTGRARRAGGRRQVHGHDQHP
jgi:CBS domain-containing protein